jgi:hypothetical protein
MAEQKLTPKQEAAVHEFMKNGGNKTQAYIHAYNTGNMQEATINVKACNLFKQDNIGIRLDELQKELQADNKITKEWVLEQLQLVISKSSQGEMIVGKDGETSGEWKYDSSGVNKALDTINKMMGFNAPEKKELSGTITTRRTINLHPSKKK